MSRLSLRLLALAWTCALSSACEASPARGSDRPASPPALVASADAHAANGAAPAPSPKLAAAPKAAAALPAATPRASPAPRLAGTDLDPDALLLALAHGEPTGFKPVGSTSTVFRMRQRGGVDAAWKARTENRPHGPASEVAAYRVSRCLGLDNVPPAVSRDLPAATVHALLDPRFEAKWPEIRERMGVDEGGVVRGAAIYWLPELLDVGVDKRAGLARAHEWLRQGGELPAEKRSLAASLSSMLAFDYLIGNFDRWSGDNVQGNRAGTFVYVRDHDQAFPIGMGERLHRQVLDDLLKAERFSKQLYARLKAFDRACLERELAQDPEGAKGGLLNARQIADLFDRRETLLSHIDALIAEHGERDVLVFE